MEHNWPAWGKEAAAIKLALVTWRHLLEGARISFEVWTDNKNLEALKQPRKLRERQLRWVEFFSNFQFTLHHLPGKTNFLADALSRLPQHDSQRSTEVDTVFSKTQLGGAVLTLKQKQQQEMLPKLLSHIKKA